ncbi:MAG TPA: dephospho-CoA kinase [Bacteroidales bacterium]|nr:dephospho-CoA kinase [Bacteroidales bacterium]
MMKVGLTGNMGSGKSLAASVFGVLGIPVYQADPQSKKFLSDPGVKEKIASKFGKGVLDAAGEVDRLALGAIVFTDAVLLNFLTTILHPLVREDFREWFGKQPDHPYVIHEAAIIFESGFEKEFDRVIHVACPKELAIRRIMERDGYTREHVLDRMRFQWDDREKEALADFVIRNDGSEMLLPQILEIHRRLTEINKKK